MGGTISSRPVPWQASRSPPKAGGILIPSEEDELEVFPLTFKEFLQAKGEARIIPFLESTLKKPSPLRSALPKISYEFRTYMPTGGMPNR